MLRLGSTLLKHGRHFDYSNLSPNMRMRVCYLDYHGHDAGLCCYLVNFFYLYYIAIYNLLRFYRVISKLYVGRGS
jgi:hypothetical protein